METQTTTRRKAPATVAEVNSYREPGRYSVGDGLLLVVNGSGSRSWLARIRDPNGKRRDIGLGRYPEVSLKEARDRAAEHRKTARDGLDPVAEKRKARTTVPTFADACRTVYEERKGTFSNDKHAWQWITTLEQFVWPSIGRTPVDKVTNPMIVSAMKGIWTSKPETARRTLGRVATVIAWATAHGYREHEASITAIRMGLPPQPKGVKHYAAVAYADAPLVVKKLRAQPESIARLALQFVILTAVRSGEARGARWSEVDLDAATWTVPADRMKMKVEHVVPLSTAALTLLRELHAKRTGGLIFPGTPNKRTRKKEEQPLSDVGLNKALAGVAENVTVHGWRSTFRTWGAEETSFPDGVLEKSLAHQIRSAVERAYNRAGLLEKRRQLMEAWANYLDEAPANVIAIRPAA